MKSERLRVDVVKAKIPFQGMMEKVDQYHVYEVYKNGTSKLMGVLLYKKHAIHFKNYLKMSKR